MDLELAGRTAAVAAATAGLGLASARALATEGVDVVICGRDADRLAAALDGCKGLPGAVTGLVADVGTPEGATGFIEAATAAVGPLDIVVPNAGGPPVGTFASTPLEAYLPALELNLLSVVAMCRAAVPAMRARGWGRVVAITSVSVRQPIPTLILSNTARAGATAFLKTLALEVAGDGITVNSVQPGYHATDRLVGLHGGDVADVARQVPAGKVGDPDDFGAVVAFLCSERANFITGAAVPVDGGTYKGLQ